MSKHPAAPHHAWGKAARHHASPSSVNLGEESSEDAHSNGSLANNNKQSSSAGVMDVEAMDYYYEEDTLEIRPTLRSGRASSNRGDARASSGHRRDRERGVNRDNNRQGRDKGDLRSSLSSKDRRERRERLGDGHRSEKRARQEREEGERDEVSSSDGSRHGGRYMSPSVAPTSVADAVQSETSSNTGAAQERAIRERLEKSRLEKLAQERAAREKQLKDELRKLGQDLTSPAQKARLLKKPESAEKKQEKQESKDTQKESEEKAKQKVKLTLPSRGMSTFIEEPEISSPESVVEQPMPEPAAKPKKTYEYSKFGDLDPSDESNSSPPAGSKSGTRSFSISPDHSASPGEPKISTMQRYLSDRLESASLDGMSPAAIARRAAQEIRNSPARGASPSSASGFASSTFIDLFTDKPYEDSPRQIPPEVAALPAYYPALAGCRSVEEFECMNRIDEGTYGVVYRAKEKKTNEVVALKRLKMEKEREGFPITSLREISTLLKAQHTNIVTVREIVVGSNMDKIYIVMDFVEHDLKVLMESMASPFLPGEAKTLMIQLLRGVAHMHENWIIHRDLKTSNLLLSHRGVLKIGDFGLAREYGSPLKPYTQVVVTLWYRSPELLLGTKMYSTAVDMWSCGCIFAELINKKPLFPGRTEMEQLNKIFQVLGTPNEKIWPNLSQLPGWKRTTFADQPYNSLRNKFDKGMLPDQGFRLMNSFLTYNPERRISAADALKHEYFREKPLPVPPSMFPTWPAKSEGGSKPKKQKKHTTPRAPEAGVGAYAKLLGEDDDEERFKLNVAQGPSLFQIKP